MEVVLKLSKKFSHLVVPDEVGLRMILTKPENTRKFCQVLFPFFPTKRKENIYSFKTTASELIILYTTYFSNCRAKWSLGAWDRQPGTSTIDTELLDEERRLPWLADPGKLSHNPPNGRGDKHPSHWINSGNREGREGGCLKTCSHAKQRLL